MSVGPKSSAASSSAVHGAAPQNYKPESEVPHGEDVGQGDADNDDSASPGEGHGPLEGRLGSKLPLLRSAGVGSLPVEMLVTVFNLLVEDHSAQLASIALVCTHWRALCLAAPDLWRSLLVTGQTEEARTNAWIRRAKGRITTLRLHADDDVEARLALDTLEGMYWPALRVLHVEVEGPCVWQRTVQWIDAKAGFPVWTQLRELCVDAAPFMGGPPWQGQLKLLPSEKKTRMRTLTLSYLSPHLCDLAHSFGELTYLKVTSANMIGSYTQLLSALAANPKLETLFIAVPPTTVPDPDNWPSRRRASLRLERLVHLHLSGFDDALDLFKDIRMTSLEILVLVNMQLPIGYALLNLAGSFKDSSYSHDFASLQLAELTIRQCTPFDAPFVLALLRQAPRLESLELSGLVHGVNEVVERLAATLVHSEAPDGANQPHPYDNAFFQSILCPSLRRIDVSHSRDVTTGPLRRLVEVRRHLSSQYGLGTSESTNGANCRDGADPSYSCTRAVARIVSVNVTACPFVDEAAVWGCQDVDDIGGN